MSADLRRHIAYFGSREKVYTEKEGPEIPGLPNNWRRVLCQSHPSPIVGPFGNMYADMEHALIAFRYVYASSCPHYSEMFRMEHLAFAKGKACRRYGSSNGLSVLQSNPDDRVWFILRDKCMFDIVYQRICRDEEYRSILRELIKRRFTPVYHVRTADPNTYWGATMNKDVLRFTNKNTCPGSHTATDKFLEDLSTEYTESNFDLNPSQLLIGRNRLGEIMVRAYQIFVEVYEVGVVVRNISIHPQGLIMPAYPISPLAPSVITAHSHLSDPQNAPHQTPAIEIYTTGTKRKSLSTSTRPQSKQKSTDQHEAPPPMAFMRPIEKKAHDDDEQFLDDMFPDDQSDTSVVEIPDDLFIST